MICVQKLGPLTPPGEAGGGSEEEEKQGAE